MRVIRKEIMVDYTSEKEFKTDYEARANQHWRLIEHYPNDMGKYKYTAIYELDLMGVKK